MALPLLYFAHANGFPGGSYRTFLQLLEGYFQTRALDMIGHEPAWPVGRHWHALSRQLEQQLAPLPKPIVGVGHSMGGLLMFMVATRQPAWFKGLVMMDPPLINGWQARFFALARGLGLGDQITPAGKSRGRRDFWPSREEAVAYFHRRGFFTALDTRCLEDYINAALIQDKDGWRLRFRPEIEVEIFRHTPTDIDRYPKLMVPALMLSGSDSPVMFHRCVSRLVDQHNMLWKEMAGGHMFPLEQPEKAAALLLEGLNELNVIHQSSYGGGS